MSLTQQEMDDRKRRAVEEGLVMKTASITVHNPKSMSTYLVSLYDKGRSICNCPDFIHRGKSDLMYSCKHIYLARSGRFSKPQCPYGAKCTRSNLFHKEEYEHPSS
jgi:hypothetical protein